MVKSKKSKNKLFTIESVLGKRFVGDNIEYLLKWKNYPNEVNSWEPAENLTCLALIEAFKKSSKGKRSGDNTDNSTNSKKPKLQVTNHLPIAEKVIAVEKVENGKLEFHMKMMNVDKLHVFSAEEAHMQYPLLVIEFYEKRLFWKAPERQDI